ncbi:D-arabinono-1,4-lactone oxidase [Nocardioides euryhalodurans]|uniref:FAD-binding protein n=1 Tax=Nocardioides euryhalodurans TaxID=2518370 RepID=A0A4P7GGU8_9ACTN|nr:D-arabinono-1,4-lactone oxidase [Nocardioides euryhalodurans]QBR90941.1 FAD-binding protein [Nocardioides euryhalodurans]
MEWRNWSGLASATPREAYAPRTTDDVRTAVTAVRAAGSTVKMVGTGHSFTAIAAPEDVLLLPTALTGIVGVDREAMTVTARAGTPLHVLNDELARLGLSLHNMGDIAEQTVAGAVSTGTHGSGGRVASLSAQLRGLELVTGTGELLRASATENADVLELGRIGLGALGVLTTVTFAVEPAFLLRAHERPLGWEECLAGFEELAAAHDHVDAYWFPHTDLMQVKTNDRLAVPVEQAEPLPRWRAWLDDDFLANTLFAGLVRTGRAAPRTIAPINRFAARALSERSYIDVSHRVFTTPRRVRFREMEYAVPREAGMAALREVRRAVEASDWRIGFPVEIRVVPADDVPLSPAYGRDSVYLAVHTPARTDHLPYFTGVEQILRDHGGRPHWGKLHTLGREDLALLHPRYADFLALRDRLDPDRVFANGHLRRVLGE